MPLNARRIGLFAMCCPLLVSTALVPATTAAQQPPIDGAGRYKHVLTVTPEKATAPMPIGPPLRMMAYGKSPSGELLLIGDAEHVVLTSAGRIDRRRWGGSTVPFPTMGTVAWRGNELRYCAQADKRMWRLVDGGKQRKALSVPLGFSASCQLFSGKRGFLATQGWPMVGVHVDDNGKVLKRLKLAQAFLPQNKDKAVVPCGMDDAGRPLATIPSADRKQVTLWRLDDGLKATDALWTLALDKHGLGKALQAVRLPTATGCGWTGGHAVFWFNGQVLVFEGQQLVTALRNGTAFSERNGHAQAGNGPYGFSVITAAHLLDGGKVLAVVTRDTGEIKLYAADKATAAKLRKRPDPDEIKAELLRRWAERMMDMGPMAANIPHPRPLAEQYLAQAQTIAARKPQLPIAHAAVASLAERAGKPSLRAIHLEKLAGALQKSGDRSAALRYPALFTHFARLGDRQHMRRFVAMSRGSTDPMARRWRAQLARAEGKPAQGVAAIKGLDDPESLKLRAQLLMDAGELNDAIAAWTRGMERGLNNDPDAHNGMGLAWLQRGMVELAIQSFNKAVQADPDNATFRANLATAYARHAKRNDAMKHVSAALSKAPDDPLLRLQLQHLSAAPTDKKPPKKPTVMVAPLSTMGSDVARAGLGELVAAMLISAISSKGGVTVLERDRLTDVMAEQKLQRGRAFDRKTAVKLGKLVGAKTLITGNVAEFRGRLVLDIRSVSVETGAVLQAVHGEAPLDATKIDASLRKLVGQLTRNAR